MTMWAIAWMLVRLGAEQFPLVLFLFTMATDVAIAFFLACAVRGWPK